MTADGADTRPALTVAVAAPLAPEARALIAAAQAEMEALYPPEEIFSLTPEAMAERNVVFLMARLQDRAAGCVALVDRLTHATINRLYVAPEARGRGIGRALMAAAEDEARDLGLATLRLETGDRLPAALGLYRALGYADCAPFDGLPDTGRNIFMEKRLA